MLHLIAGLLLNFNPLPRKEGDDVSVGIRACRCHFNPLPRKEGDSYYCQPLYDQQRFQSTPS